MKVGYNKRHMNVNLIFGLVWMIWFLIIFFVNDEHSLIDYGWAFISVMYFSVYFYQRNHKYLTIENDYIKLNRPFGTKLRITEIKEIKKFAGDYIIRTDKKELTIDSQLIDPHSNDELYAVIEKLRSSHQRPV